MPYIWSSVTPPVNQACQSRDQDRGGAKVKQTEGKSWATPLLCSAEETPVRAWSVHSASTEVRASCSAGPRFLGLRFPQFNEPPATGGPAPATHLRSSLDHTPPPWDSEPSDSPGVKGQNLFPSLNREEAELPQEGSRAACHEQLLPGVVRCPGGTGALGHFYIQSGQDWWPCALPDHPGSPGAPSLPSAVRHSVRGAVAISVPTLPVASPVLLSVCPRFLRALFSITHLNRLRQALMLHVPKATVW